MPTVCTFDPRNTAAGKVFNFLLVQYLKGESCSLVHCGSVVGAIFHVYELNG